VVLHYLFFHDSFPIIGPDRKTDSSYTAKRTALFRVLTDKLWPMDLIYAVFRGFSEAPLGKPTCFDFRPKPFGVMLQHSDIGIAHFSNILDNATAVDQVVEELIYDNGINTLYRLTLSVI
jgi:hypothetical protein